MATTLKPLADVAIPSISELQANAARLLQQSLAVATQASDPAALSASDLELARSNTAALAFVQAAGLHGAYRYLRDFVARQAVPIFSVEEFLDGWLATYGMVRKAASSAVGQVTGTGVAGTPLAAGTLLRSAFGLSYTVQSGVVVAAGGTWSANVTAVTAGAASNLAAGEDLSLVSAVSGIDTAAVAGTAGISGGSDTESDADAVYRLQQRLSNEPRGGSPADYARWALSVPGITRAWGVRNPSGPCTAGVIIIADGNGGYGLPTSTQQSAVYDYIRDPRRGPPDELFVIIPTPVVQNLTLWISPDSTELRAAVQSALQDLFLREAVPGGSIPYSHASEVISTVMGEYNHAIVSPVVTAGGAFSTSSYEELLMLGTITWASAPA